MVTSPNKVTPIIIGVFHRTKNRKDGRREVWKSRWLSGGKTSILPTFHSSNLPSFQPSILMQFSFSLLICTIAMSCGNEETKKKKEIDPSLFKEQLMKVNKYEVEKESDEINQYIAHHPEYSGKMKKTGTGLRYMFLKKGNGALAQSGDHVKVNYKISLLDGTECYSSDKEGAYEFQVEGDAIESGLHEAIQLMRVGDRAKFILPSYRAHGLHGDDANIPPLSTIVVDLELLEIK